MTDLEILQSLPSLYPLKDYEEEAILNVCKMFEDIKAEIENECKSIGDFPIYDNVLVGKHLGLMVAIDIINQHISGK